MLLNPSRILCCALILSLAGCQKMSLGRGQKPDDDDDVKTPRTVYIRDQVAVTGLNTVQVETVGIVMGLDGTGGDTPPSMYRTMALDEMRRRSVPNPNEVLRSPNTALVIVRAALPPVVQRGDHFDVEVVLPENSEATSLRGGYLLQCSLSEQAIIPGRGPAKGHVLAIAEGPVLISTGEGESSSQAGVLKRGRILGGGVYKGGILKKDREMGLYLRNDLRTVRQARRVASAIGKRFHSFERGIKKPLAEAKTDQFIELKIHPRYKENYIRYVQVIRQIALSETPVEQRERLEQLRKSLLVPQTASKSAMELEAIGAESILILKEGLKSPSAEVRFYSADALAYLGDSSGAKELAAAARNEEAFRVFALAALATLDDQQVRGALQELMTEPTLEVKGDVTRELYSAETRYGAFRALSTIDKGDDSIRGERMNDGAYTLHALQCSGEPMVHLSTHRVPEVVVFNDDMRMRTPILLSAGLHIMITAAAGSDTVRVCRYQVGVDTVEEVNCSTRVVDIIRAVNKLRANYPDVAQMLVQAERGSNLMGRLELDALPQAGRLYHRPPAELEVGNTATASETTTRVGRPNLVPNMFPAVESKGSTDLDQSEQPSDATPERPSTAAGEASLVDARDSNEKPAPKRKSGLFNIFRK
ncbi:MAG: flagellar basal body P-ring protein FlgI [Planctomycetales bacterium]